MSNWNPLTHPFRLVRTFTHPSLHWVQNSETFATWAELKAAALSPMPRGCYHVALDVTTIVNGNQGRWINLGTRKTRCELKLTKEGKSHENLAHATANGSGFKIAN